MHTISRFTYPTFIGLCGLLATLSDILQNATVSVGVIVALLALGLGCVILPRSLLIDRVWSGMLGNDVGHGFSAKPFGLSCVLLAGLMYGFSTLSTKAADEGGVIASQFPEIRQMQVILGIVQQDVAEIKAIATEIKGDTSRLLDSADRWMLRTAVRKSTTVAAG